MEACPCCEQQTASHLFREVHQKRLCLLCAKRAEDTAASHRALAEDHRVHGGLGWLWKHAAYTAAAAAAYTIVRHVILHFVLND